MSMRLRFVLAAALLLAFVLGASLARASGWEAFEARCLGPMEAIAVPVTDGLEQRKSVLSDTLEAYEAGDAWFPPEGGYALMLTGDPGCLVLAEPGDGSIAEAAAWRAAALAEGRYEETGEPERLHSRLWREPVLAVVIRAGDGPAVFAAIETALES